MLSQQLKPVNLTLTTADGYPLAATRYPARGATRGHLVMAGATGVPQGFYRRFAEFACSQGYEVMTLDYRGIGRSRPATLKGFRMDYLDWGRQDLAAAVDAMSTPHLPLYVSAIPTAATPSAFCLTTTRWRRYTPSPPAPAGMAGCRWPSACA